MDKFDMELIEQLEDQASALAPGIMASAVAERPETKAVALIHDQAAEIVRLKAERDNWKMGAELYQEANIKQFAHNAAMRTALEDMVTAYGGLGSKPVDFARQALAPDAGKPILKVVTTGIEWWRTVVAFAIDPEVTEDDVGLAERRHMDAISALNASRTEGQDDG